MTYSTPMCLIFFAFKVIAFLVTVRGMNSSGHYYGILQYHGEKKLSKLKPNNPAAYACAETL